MLPRPRLAQPIREFARAIPLHPYEVPRPGVRRPLPRAKQHRLMARLPEGAGKPQQITLRASAARISAANQADSHESGCIARYFTFTSRNRSS